MYRSDNPAHVSVFAIGEDGNLWERVLGEEWSWVNHGNGGSSGLVAGPSAISLPKEIPSLRVVCMDRAGGIREKRLESEWSWTYISPPQVDLVMRPEILYRPSDADRVSIFVVANNGDLWESVLTSQEWKWVAHRQCDSGGPIYSGPAALYRNGKGDPYGLSVFVASWSNNLQEWSYKPSEGEGWHNHEYNISPVASRPSALYLNPPDEPWMRVYVIGEDGNLYERKFNGHSGWVWTSVGSSGSPNVFGAPSAVNRKISGAPQDVSVFALTSEGNLVEAALESDKWAWVNHGNNASTVISSQPSAVAFPAGTFDDGTTLRVFTVDTSGTLQERYLPSSGWGWYSHGQPS
ncbi:hypothetical protein [Streptomyces celluloflavus]|uniref:hypothetical protein n=1 Tax=Streptomyces celluloflavus TaxID=58344 RepID=UPI00364D71CD